MLLTKRRTPKHPHLLFRFLGCTLLLIVHVVLAEEPPPPCFLEVPVYDPLGSRLSFDIRSVTVENGGKKLDLLKNSADGISVTAKADRLYFSSSRIVGSRPMEITLDGPHGAHLTARIIVTQCRLRQSLFFGQSDLGFDVKGVNIRGRLSGCQFTGDWWVRSMPMFGPSESADVEDGYVEPSGQFWISVGATGVRRLLVIGKGSQPVRAIAFDVTVGKPRHDIGLISIAGGCPN
jgi:hypothetical protein